MTRLTAKPREEEKVQEARRKGSAMVGLEQERMALVLTHSQPWGGEATQGSEELRAETPKLWAGRWPRGKLEAAVPWRPSKCFWPSPCSQRSQT